MCRKKQKGQYVLLSKKGQVKSAILFILLIVLVLGIAFITVMSIYPIEQIEFTSLSSIIRTIRGEHTDFQTADTTLVHRMPTHGRQAIYVPCGEYLMVATGEDIRGYDKNGNPVLRELIETVNPITAHNDRIAVIAERRFTGNVFIYRGAKRIAHFQLANLIRNVTVDKDGTIVIVAQDPNGNSTVHVFDETGKKLAEIVKQERIIIVGTVLASSHRMALVSVSVAGASILSNLEFINLAKQSVQSVHVAEAKLFPILIGLGDSTAVIANEVGLYGFDTNAQLLWTHEPGEIAFVRPYPDGLVVAFFNHNDETSVWFLDEHGKKRHTVQFSDAVDGMHATSGTVAIHFGRYVRFIDQNGILQKRYDATADILDVWMLGPRMAAVRTHSEILFIRLYERGLFR